MDKIQILLPSIIVGIFSLNMISPVYAQICFLNAQHVSTPEGLGTSIVLFPIVGIVTFFVSYRLLRKSSSDSSKSKQIV